MPQSGSVSPSKQGAGAAASPGSSMKNPMKIVRGVYNLKKQEQPSVEKAKAAFIVRGFESGRRKTKVR